LPPISQLCALLQPVLAKLGVQLDPRTAHALINREPGLAGKVLYSIKQALGSMSKDTQVRLYNCTLCFNHGAVRSLQCSGCKRRRQYCSKQMHTLKSVSAVMLEPSAVALQALEHTGRTMQQFGVRTSPTRGMLEAQHYSTQQAAYQSGNLKYVNCSIAWGSIGAQAMLGQRQHFTCSTCLTRLSLQQVAVWTKCSSCSPHSTLASLKNLPCRFFEDVMRKKVGSPNALMESMHLKRFADEGSRQAMTAADSAAAEAAAQLARKAAMRDGQLGKLAAARADKSLRLQRDEAVHAALLKHQVGGGVLQ
jgi:hypothetical protein